MKVENEKTITLYASENDTKGTEYEITIDYDSKRLLEVIKIDSKGRETIYGLFIFDNDEEIEKKFNELIKEVEF